jgi:hypothetical protein
VSANTTSDVERLVRVLGGIGSGDPVADLRGQRVTLPTSERVQTLLAAARRIEEAGIAVADLAIRRPSLDDVFLTLTGAPASKGALRAVPGEATAPLPRETWQATA